MIRQMKTPDGYAIKEEYAALKTLDERLEWINDSMDEGRLDTRGGYPSQWTTRGGWIYVATVDHDDAPELIAISIRQFSGRTQLGMGGELLGGP
jgi:hypothetical protein